MQSDSLSALNAPPSRIRRARREDVVAAAIAAIDRDGYAAATVDAIARESGTTKSTVLYHFGSRDAVMAAVLDELFEVGAAYMAERVPSSAPWRATLLTYVDANLRFIAANAAHVRAVHRIQLGGGAGPNGEAGPSSAEVTRPLRRLLAAGQESGELGAFDPDVAALVIRAIIDGASFHLTDDDLNVDGYIDQVVVLVDRAVGPAVDSSAETSAENPVGAVGRQEIP